MKRVFVAFCVGVLAVGGVLLATHVLEGFAWTLLAVGMIGLGVAGVGPTTGAGISDGDQ